MNTPIVQQPAAQFSPWHAPRGAVAFDLIQSMVGCLSCLCTQSGYDRTHNGYTDFFRTPDIQTSRFVITSRRFGSCPFDTVSLRLNSAFFTMRLHLPSTM